MTMFTEKDQLAITAIRTLSIDAIEKANSGHPGMPMGAAPMANTLFIFCNQGLNVITAYRRKE